MEGLGFYFPRVHERRKSANSRRVPGAVGNGGFVETMPYFGNVGL